MEFTRDEMQRACTLAARCVEQRIEQFKPVDKPMIRNQAGRICEQVYCGSVEDILMCQIKLQWNYPSENTVGRIFLLVHVRLRCVMKPDGGRRIGVLDFHIPSWGHNLGVACYECWKIGLEEGGRVIVADTSSE